MKKVSFFLSVVTLFFVSFYFISCNKESEGTAESEVVFAINSKRLKTLTNYELSDVVKAVFTIQTEDGSATKYTMSEIKIFNFNGSFITEKVILKTGIFKLTQFLLLDGNGNTIFAAPIAGSQEAQNVDNPLEIAFACEKNKANPVEVSVLSTEKKKPSDFGYNYFVINEIKLINFMVGVAHSQTPEILSAKLTVTSDSYTYVTELDAIANNVVSVRDGFNSYTLTISKVGFIPFNKTFSKTELLEYENESGNLPLLVSLEPNTEEEKDIEMVLVDGGTFVMGGGQGQTNIFTNELPVHNVTLSSFYIGKYEITQAQYAKVMGINPAFFSDNTDKPVEQVSWHSAIAFCNEMSRIEGLAPCYTINGTVVTFNTSAKGYRLPTEAEWEYASRGGSNFTNYYTYSGSNSINEVGWDKENSYNLGFGNPDYGTQPVGSKLANKLGIYDMSGNVWEWCWDWFGNYSGSDATNPTGGPQIEHKVYRGGSWAYETTYSRSSARGYGTPTNGSYSLGFRIVRIPTIL